MLRKDMERFLYTVLKDVTRGEGATFYKDPWDVLMEKEAAGELDDLTKEEKERRRQLCLEMGNLFWGCRKKVSGYEIISQALEQARIQDGKLRFMAETIADSMNTYTPGLIVDGGNTPPVDIAVKDRKAREKCSPLHIGTDWEDSFRTRMRKDNEAAKEKPKQASFTPKELYDYLSRRIYGQEDAKRAASMLLWEHMQGIKSVVLFAGPTGSGKTEIFRQLEKIYDNIHIIDASLISEEGFKGDFKVADIFKNIGDPHRASKALIVFDEADKFFEPKFSASGENIAYSRQNELLKIIEGEDIYVGGAKYDTRHMSFVFCGAFENLLESKNSAAGEVGFGRNIEKSHATYESMFTSDDLVKHAGVRNEIAGRITRIVQLKPMTEEMYLKVLDTPSMSPINALSEEFRREIDVSDTVKERLAKEAAESGMGVRCMASRLKSMIEDQLFEDTEKEKFCIEGNEDEDNDKEEEH